MSYKPHPQDARAKAQKAKGAAAPTSATANSPTPAKAPARAIPPPPQPSAAVPASPVHGSADSGRVGSQVAMGSMPEVTAENYTKFSREALIQGFGNTSNAIRGLGSLGVKPGPISKHLDIRYQHARNVLERPLKREIVSEKRAQTQVRAQQSQDQTEEE